ncbi:hypothetical protein MMC29_005592, partial [Sticta canariensis]|nr:hypothetical protein [Sticta canariensis]
MNSAQKSTSLDSVLVIGGCGFLGFHIVRLLLEDPDCSTVSVSVLSRNPNRNRLPGVSYHAGDISNPQAIQSLLDELKPRVIIHAAAPSGHAVTGNPSVYRETNIKGTMNLLDCAARVSSPIAFVYTSTSVVIVGSEHNLADESSPVLNASSKENEYAKTKAIADTLVLEANDPGKETENGLRTACIRLTAMYGERDTQITPNLLGLLRRGENRFQLGDNSNLFDWVHVENAAMAHILAAKALVAESMGPKKDVDRALNVSGEAFFITDDAPLPFWDLPRKMWAAAGHPISTDKKVWVIPTKWALRSAMAVEWIVWAISLGTKRPQTFSRQAVEYCCLTRTYCIDKAKKRLGYAARDNVEEGVRQAVAWVLKDEPLELGRKKRTE